MMNMATGFVMSKCNSVVEVSQCIYCGKFVCKEHNYGNDVRCCYDCSIERTYGKK